MTNAKSQNPMEKKKNFLMRLRDAYLQQRQECREDKELLAHPQGVPKFLKNADPSEFRWTNKSFTLGVFKKIVKMVRHPEMRENIVHDLDAIATGKTGDERLGYIQNRLGYTIFREVTGKPYSVPMYASLVKVQNVINHNFLELIYKGIFAYKNAPTEIREKFNKAVLPKVKKEKVVAPNISQQQR